MGERIKAVKSFDGLTLQEAQTRLEYAMLKLEELRIFCVGLKDLNLIANKVGKFAKDGALYAFSTYEEHKETLASITNTDYYRIASMTFRKEGGFLILNSVRLQSVNLVEKEYLSVEDMFKEEFEAEEDKLGKKGTVSTALRIRMLESYYMVVNDYHKKLAGVRNDIVSSWPVTAVR